MPTIGWKSVRIGCVSLLVTGPSVLIVTYVGARANAETPPDYSDPAAWVCASGRQDPCGQDPDVRRLEADGRLIPAPVAHPTRQPAVDCFYVYPTVDFSLIPGNPDRRGGDRGIIDGIVRTQALPFRPACRIFAPLYRQATIGAYLLPEKKRREFIAVAAVDVTAAFDHYLAHENHGRKFVLIGHSQGAEVLIDMMKARIDGNAELRKRMSLALLVGVPAFVPVGETRGGTFSTIPVCAAPFQTGCFLGFASWEDGSNPKDDARIPTPPGQERVCVNPATLDDVDVPSDERRTARRLFSETYLPPASYIPVGIRSDPRTRTFTRLPATFSGACTSTPTGNRFLSIREEVPKTDRRYGVIKLRSNEASSPTATNWQGVLSSMFPDVGLHAIDMQFPMKDMVGLVDRRAAKGATTTAVQILARSRRPERPSADQPDRRIRTPLG